MPVTVRLFAAVREAAGTAEVAVDPAPLPALLAALRDRFGEPFSTRLELCTVLVDGDAVSPGTPVDVGDGAEVVLLPPVSGGAAACAGEPGAHPASSRRHRLPAP